MSKKRKLTLGFARVLLIFSVILILALSTQILQLQRTLHTSPDQLVSSSLTTSVEVLWDENHVPHIFSEDEYGAYFALGVLHAENRSWQMEMSRRIVQGRMSEIVGRLGVQFDTVTRTLGLYEAAHDSIPNLSKASRVALEAYSDGVNQVFEERGRSLSPEFILLGHTPERWTPTDSVAVLRMMSVGLSTNLWSELQRSALLSEITPQELTELQPPYPGDEAIVLPSLSDLFPFVQEDEEQVSFTLPNFGSIEASNNWVIDGHRTTTGAPLLANDPHLGFSAPSIWYLAHMQTPEGDIIGATLPGFPLVVLGRTNDIAWGFTNTGPDTQDLYVEQLNPENLNEYRTPDGWQVFESRKETIKVRFGRDIEIDVRQTRHGPVLPTSLVEDLPMIDEGHVLALAWTGLASDERAMDGLLGARHAKDWTAFNTALRHFHSPMQNIVYADVRGNIGFVAPGIVPVRGPDHQTKGMLPAPGWLEQNDWVGYIPFDELPRVYNPTEGMIVTANQKIVPDDYNHHLTYEWGVPYRANRIANLIKEKEKHTIESLAAIQTDNVSDYAKEMLPLLLRIGGEMEDPSRALNLLETWEGHMQADGIAPLLFSAWTRHLGKIIVEQRLGDSSARISRPSPYFLINVLNDKDGQSHWCGTSSMDPEPNCDQLVSNALNEAIDDLEDRLGKDWSEWRWGSEHRAVHEHRPFGFFPILKNYFNIVSETGGGPFTPNQGSYYGSGSSPFVNRHGAGYRAVYDFEDLDRSVFVQTTGQSGNILSEQYRDFEPHWREGRLLPMVTDREILEPLVIKRMTIDPNQQ